MGEPLSAQDRLDVMEVIAAYPLCLDSPDIEGLAGVFHPEAVLDGIGGSFSGLDAILGWARGLIAGGRVGASPPQLVHFVGLPHIEGDSERCRAQTYAVIITYDAAKAVTIPLVGSYHDRFAKQDGRWRIERRTIRGDLGRPPARPN